MSLPYYKRFPRDFLEGTVGLPFETKGAYSIVLDLIYLHDGRLPDDTRYIAGQIGCSVRKWSTIRSELIKAGKLTADLGIISNFRADYLTEETRKYQNKQAENAGRPKKFNDLPEPPLQPKPSQSESESESIERERDKSLSPTTGFELEIVSGGRPAKRHSSSFEDWWLQYPRKIDKGSARRVYERVVKSGKATPDALVLGVLRYAAERQNEDLKFTKHATTWLNAEGWLNEPQSMPTLFARPQKTRADTAVAGVMSILADDRPFLDYAIENGRKP